MPRTELVVTLGDRFYAVERPWEQLPPGMKLEFVRSVVVDSAGYVYLFKVGDPPVVVLDPEGTYVRGWGTGLITDVHGGFITPDDRIWLADRDAHQVLSFDTAGQLVSVLGQRHSPRFQEPFNHPTDVCVAPNGNIYVSDGYGNSRVHCFTPDGELICSWGHPGSGPGQFTTPHAVWVAGDGRVLVADRENNRVQVFTATGEYVTEWPDLYHPMDIYEDRDGLVLVTDQIPRTSAFSPDGRLVGRCRPVPYEAHGLWGDPHGNIYLAEMRPMNRITKLTPLPHAP